jgi:hypothetical protein
MALNVAALASLALALAAAVLLFRRHARAAATLADPSNPNVCLRCNLPASYLTSFICPACNHDVREFGVGPPRARAKVLNAFWLAVAFTTAYLIAATVAGNVLFNVLPREQTVSRTRSLRISSAEIEGAEFTLETRGRGEYSAPGTLGAELYAAGGVVVLEADVPSLRWRMTDPDGRRLATGDRLDGAAIRRWIELAGVDPDTPLARSVGLRIADNVSTLTRVPIAMPPEERGRVYPLSYSSSAGGGSFTRPDPRWTPLLIIAAAALWLAVIAFLFRPRRDPTINQAQVHPPGAPAETTPGAPTGTSAPAPEVAP